jgi:hypothetical protein
MNEFINSPLWVTYTCIAIVGSVLGIVLCIERIKLVKDKRHENKINDKKPMEESQLVQKPTLEEIKQYGKKVTRIKDNISLMLLVFISTGIILPCIIYSQHRNNSNSYKELRDSSHRKDSLYAIYENKMNSIIKEKDNSHDSTIGLYVANVNKLNRNIMYLSDSLNSLTNQLNINNIELARITTENTKLRNSNEELFYAILVSFNSIDEVVRNNEKQPPPEPLCLVVQ